MSANVLHYVTFDSPAQVATGENTADDDPSGPTPSRISVPVEFKDHVTLAYYVKKALNLVFLPQIASSVPHPLEENAMVTKLVVPANLDLAMASSSEALSRMGGDNESSGDLTRFFGGSGFNSAALSGLLPSVEFGAINSASTRSSLWPRAVGGGGGGGTIHSAKRKPQVHMSQPQHPARLRDHAVTCGDVGSRTRARANASTTPTTATPCDTTSTTAPVDVDWGSLIAKGGTGSLDQMVMAAFAVEEGDAMRIRASKEPRAVATKALATPSRPPSVRRSPRRHPHSATTPVPAASEPTHAASPPSTLPTPAGGKRLRPETMRAGAMDHAVARKRASPGAGAHSPVGAVASGANGLELRLEWAQDEILYQRWVQPAPSLSWSGRLQPQCVCVVRCCDATSRQPIAYNRLKPTRKGPRLPLFQRRKTNHVAACVFPVQEGSNSLACKLGFNVTCKMWLQASEGMHRDSKTRPAGEDEGDLAAAEHGAVDPEAGCFRLQFCVYHVVSPHTWKALQSETRDANVVSALVSQHEPLVSVYSSPVNVLSHSDQLLEEPATAIIRPVSIFPNVGPCHTSYPFVMLGSFSRKVNRYRAVFASGAGHGGDIHCATQCERDSSRTFRGLTPADLPVGTYHVYLIPADCDPMGLHRLPFTPSTTTVVTYTTCDQAQWPFPLGGGSALREQQ